MIEMGDNLAALIFGVAILITAVAITYIRTR